MLLTVDVGNTNMLFGIFRGEALVGTFRLRTDPAATQDQIGLLAWSYFQRFGLDAGAVEAVVIDSVVPPVMAALTGAMRTYFGREPYVIDENLDPGLPYDVAGDERLGADRSVACVAAIAKYGAPVIVLDFGTATTLDAVSRAGAYLGGCIMAGARLSLQALFQNAALLPQVELKFPDSVLSGTTVGQLQAGAVAGYVGAVEYLVNRAKAEMGEDPDAIKVVATGGLAQTAAAHSTLIDVVDPQLLLDGLRILYRREVDKPGKADKQGADGIH